MSKILIFAEKPKVALKIAVNGRKIFGDFKIDGVTLTKDYLAKNEKSLSSKIEQLGCVENDKYIVSFAKGHLIELWQAEDYDSSYKNWRRIPYQYVPETFKFKVNSSSERLYKNLAKLMNRSDVSEIYNAGDADREGEYIFRLIYNQSNCTKPVKRIWINNQTEADLEKAYNKLEDSSKYDNLGQAGYARAISDFIMGALLTASATVNLSSKEIINVGRVQTAIIAEICRVEKLNRDFKSTKYYKVDALFKTKNGETYSGTYSEEFDNEDKAKKFVEELKKAANAKVTEYYSNNENSYSPPLYNQTALQMDMSSKYGLTPDETLSTHQKLYEDGYLSYPRTSSQFLGSGDADDFARMYNAIKIINPLALKHAFNKNNKRIIDDSKVDGHGAIIPTYEIPLLSQLNEKERELYLTVVRRVISVNFPAAVDNKQKSITVINDYEFASSGIKEVSRGWREVYELEEKDSPIPELKVGEIVDFVDFTINEVITKPPKRYTLTSILKFMETCGKKMENENFKEQMKNKGLGTDATRAHILNGLQSHKYIILKGKTIYPTDKAMNLIDIFPVDELKSAEYTGELEYDLYRVSKGEFSYDEFMDKVINLYKISCEKICNNQKKIVEAAIEGSLGTCPDCGKPVTKKESSYGTFYSCTGYKSGCKFKINKICNKTLTEKQVSKLLGEKCVGPIKGLKKKDGTELSEAYVVLEKNEETNTCDVKLTFSKPEKSSTSAKKSDKTIEKDSAKKDEDLICPLCGGVLALRKGQFGNFYSCNNFKSGCNYKISQIASYLPTKTQIKKLLKGDKVKVAKGLKKKDGTDMTNVTLYMDDNKQIKLSFEK